DAGPRAPPPRGAAHPPGRPAAAGRRRHRGGGRDRARPPDRLEGDRRRAAGARQVRALVRHARRLRGPVTALVETLAAIPSVVIGLWGILVLGPVLRDDVEPALHGALGWIP